MDNDVLEEWNDVTSTSPKLYANIISPNRMKPLEEMVDEKMAEHMMSMLNLHNLATRVNSTHSSSLLSIIDYRL